MQLRYVLKAGHGKAFGVSYVRMVPIDAGIPERRTDIYRHVHMGVFSGIGASLMYRWSVILEEYGPEIVHIKENHNTVADAISRLDYDPSRNHHAHINFVMSKAEETGIDACHFEWKAV